jgi:hypothetical protein
MSTTGSLAADTHFGQYRIIRLLGRGGMGEVYEVEHRVLERKYALKLLPEGFRGRPEAVRRFEREAKVMANLEHPQIVRVDEFGETEGRFWLRMELVRGISGQWSEVSGPSSVVSSPSSAGQCITLGDYAGRQGERIEQGEFADILRQVLEALAHAHGKGVVHRDLKPGNILLERNAAGNLEVKVSDFGLARVIGEEFVRNQAQSSVSLSRSIGKAATLGGEESIGGEATRREDEGTSTRALLGTWEYMSPEQQHGEEADARSDVYAVGLICYRLLTGSELGMEMPSNAGEGLLAVWDPFIARALEQEAAARYANGLEMLEAFAEVHLAVETERKAWRQIEAEQRRQEAEAGRLREEEDAARAQADAAAARLCEEEAAARARGEEWLLAEQRQAREWALAADRELVEIQSLAKQLDAPEDEAFEPPRTRWWVDCLLWIGILAMLGCLIWVLRHA